MKVSPKYFLYYGLWYWLTKDSLKPNIITIAIRSISSTLAMRGFQIPIWSGISLISLRIHSIIAKKVRVRSGLCLFWKRSSSSLIPPFTVLINLNTFKKSLLVILVRVRQTSSKSSSIFSSRSSSSLLEIIFN